MVLSIKKTTILFSYLTVVTLMTFVWTFVLVAPREVAAAGIPTGTIVQVSPVQTVSPANVMVGDPVQLKVLQDVLVDGKVVIAVGALAKGEVTTAEKKGLLGKPAKIGIAVRSVEGVDQTYHLAYGNKLMEGEDKMVLAVITTLLCLIGFLIFQGGDAAISPGTPIQATIS